MNIEDHFLPPSDDWMPISLFPEQRSFIRQKDGIQITMSIVEDDLMLPNGAIQVSIAPVPALMPGSPSPEQVIEFVENVARKVLTEFFDTREFSALPNHEAAPHIRFFLSVI